MDKDNFMNRKVKVFSKSLFFMSYLRKKKYSEKRELRQHIYSAFSKSGQSIWLKNTDIYYLFKTFKQDWIISILCLCYFFNHVRIRLIGKVFNFTYTFFLMLMYVSSMISNNQSKIVSNYVSSCSDALLGSFFT